MPQTVELPDNQVAEFPDGMSQDQIKTVLQSKFPAKQPTSLIPEDIISGARPEDLYNPAQHPIAEAAAGGLIDTARQFVPHSLRDVLGLATSSFVPVVGAIGDIKKTAGLVKDVASGTPIQEAAATNFPESTVLREAEKTPEFSRERFAAGFGTATQMLMAAAMGKAIEPKPTLRETLFGKPKEEVKLDATETGKIEQGTGAERTGNDALGISTETSSGSSLRDAAQEQAAPQTVTSEPAAVSGTESPPAAAPAQTQEVALAPAADFSVERSSIDSRGRKIDGITVFDGPPNNPAGIVESERLPTGELQVFNVHVDPNLRRSGRAVGLYLKLISEAGDSPVISDTSVSESAAYAWEALKKKGISIEKNPTAKLVQKLPYGEKQWETSDGSPVFKAVGGADARNTQPVSSGGQGPVAAIEPKEAAAGEAATTPATPSEVTSPAPSTGGTKNLEGDLIDRLTPIGGPNPAFNQATAQRLFDEGRTIYSVMPDGTEPVKIESFQDFRKYDPSELYVLDESKAAPAPSTAAAEGGQVTNEPSGISNEWLKQVHGEDAIISGKGRGPKELQNIGRSRLDNFEKTADPKDDPYVRLTALREGKVPAAKMADDVSLLRAEHQRLLNAARDAYGTSRYNELAQNAADMANAIKGVAHGPASDVFRALQAADVPRYDSPADFDSIVRERLNRESTPQEQETFNKIAGERKAVDTQAIKSATEAKDRLSRYRPKETISFEDAVKAVRDQIKNLTKDCIT